MVPKGNEGLEVFVLDAINLKLKDGDNKEARGREPPPLSGEIPSKLVVLSSPGPSLHALTVPIDAGIMKGETSGETAQ